MTASRQDRFWKTTRRVTLLMLSVWLLVTLIGPWFARDLHASQQYGPTFSFWLLAEGTQLAFLVLLVVYIVAVEKVEAAYPGEPRSDQDARQAGETVQGK